MQARPVTKATVSTCRGFFGTGIKRESESVTQFPVFVSMSLVQMAAGRVEQASSSRGAKMAASSRDPSTSFSVLSGFAGTGQSHTEPSTNHDRSSVESPTYFYCFELQTRELPAT